MRTEIASYLDPNLPLAIRLFCRSCVESSPSSADSQAAAALPPGRRGDGAHLQLHQLKRTLLQSVLEETSDAALLKRLCGAANEAAELAWATSQPLLVFPCLFEELVERIRAEFVSPLDRFATAPEMALADAGGADGENADSWAGQYAQRGDAWKED
jgi:hypothetical protein